MRILVVNDDGIDANGIYDVVYGGANGRVKKTY